MSFPPPPLLPRWLGGGGWGGEGRLGKIGRNQLQYKQKKTIHKKLSPIVFAEGSSTYFIMVDHGLLNRLIRRDLAVHGIRPSLLSMRLVFFLVFLTMLCVCKIDRRRNNHVIQPDRGYGA